LRVHFVKLDRASARPQHVDIYPFVRNLNSGIQYITYLLISRSLWLRSTVQYSRWYIYV